MVGAGVSGAICAKTLAAAGLSVLVLDRGRTPGGRMASPLLGDRRVDIGASYFTVSQPQFSAAVTDWQRRGLAREWTDTFDVYSPSLGHRRGSAARHGNTRWSAPGGLRALVTDIAGGLEIQTGRTVLNISHDGRRPVVDGLEADFVVLAMPDPQARKLLTAAHGAGGLLAPVLQASEAVRYQPVLAVTAAWAEREWPFTDGVFINEHPVLTFVADDGSRRGDGAAVLVAHTTSEFAGRYLVEPAAAGPEVLASLRAIFGIGSAPLFSHVHRWTYAKPRDTHGDSHHLLAACGIGLAGDSWCPDGAPRVESAWLSGKTLADAIIARSR